MKRSTPKISRQTAIEIAAKAGVDPDSAIKYAFADPDAPIGRRGGAHRTRAAVVAAARALGVRP